MKRLLLSLVAAIVTLGFSLKADVITFLPEGSTFQVTGDKVEIPNGSIVSKDNSPVLFFPSNNADVCTLSWKKINNSSSQVTGGLIRWYQNDILRINPVSGVTVSKVTVHYSSSSYLGPFTANVGDVTSDAGNRTIIWTGSTKEQLELTASKQIRTSAIVVEYTSQLEPDAVGFNPKAGVLNAPEQVILTSGTEGAAIRYTLDGSDPTSESPIYSAPIEISNATTIKAIVGENTKVVSTASYTFATAVPEITVAGGFYADNIVTMSCATPGAKIYYTVDGSEPNEKSTEYTEAITVTAAGTTTFRAIAVSSYGTSEDDVTATAQIKQAGFPKFTPEAGTYANQPLLVSIVSPTSKAVIYYTINGDEPNENSDIFDPAKPIEIFEATTVKATAKLGNTSLCKVQIAEYTIDASLRSFTLNVNDATDLVGEDIEEVITEKNKVGRHIQPLESLLLGEFEFSFEKGSGSTAPAYYWAMSTSENQQRTIRIYSGNSMTINAPAGYAIKSISFKTDGAAFEKWEGSVATSVTLSTTSTVKIQEITIEIVEASAPMFSHASGSYFESFDLSMTTMLTDAKIYYSIDGSEPTELYNAPIKIEYGKEITVKAYAVGKNSVGEEITSPVSSATYKWGEIGQSFGNIQDLYDYYTKTQDGIENNRPAEVYVNTDYEEAVTLDFPVSVAAVSKNVLYIDDTFQLGGVNSIAVKSENIDWTEYYKAGDELKEGMIVSWGWENVVTPVLTLRGNPVEVNPDYGAYVFEPEEAAMSEVIESAAWNEEDIMYARIDKNAPMPMIRLLNPDLVSQCVLIKNVEFAKNTKANTGSTPNANFTGKGADGESLKFVTRLPISSYAAGSYDVTAVIAYEVKYTEEKTDKIGNITQEADTAITVVAYPVSMKAIQGGGEIEPGEGAVFEIAEAVEAGEFIIVANELAFAPLDDNKTYGYMAAKQVTADSDSAIADAGYALTLTVSEYVDTEDDSKAYYYMQDALGRYIYQTGNFNSFNVSTDIPENIAEASWYFEIINSGSNNPVMKITNAATGKYIQYSEKYGSYGCYPDEQGVMPSLYKAVDSTTGIEAVEGEAVSGPVEVYNLQGIRMGSTLEGLPAGLYIVRQGREVSKVIVR